MRRFVTFFIMIFIASIIAGPSMFMLSIEKGRVYTESFNLDHIIKASYSSQPKNSQDMQSSLEACRIFCHRHIILTRDSIPEELFVLAPRDIYSDVDFLPTYTAFNSLGTSLSHKQFDSSSRLKLPIPPLLQASVLLI